MKKLITLVLLSVIAGCGGGSPTQEEPMATTRPTMTVQRFINGQPIDGAAVKQRLLTPPESETGMLKPYVQSTAPLTTTQLNVAKAFLVLFGRAPDNAGLDYWTTQLGVNASLSTAVNSLIVGVAGARILDMDNASFVAMTYYHLFGKTPEEDPGGQAYWKGQLEAGVSHGSMVEAIEGAVAGIAGYHPDVMRNRMNTLESICRLQKSQSYDLRTQDSRTAVLRVVGESISYEEAMSDIYRLLVSRTASTPLTWSVNLTASQLYSKARVPDNTTIRQHRYLVWYNRDGDMMLAEAFLPTNFEDIASHRGIISFHGGGWRQGYPDKIYGYNTAFATGTDPSYVVVSPSYHLTAYTAVAPTMQNDAADLRGLVVNSPFFKIDSTKLGMFGESSGGHLALMVGSSQNAHRIFAIYPPTDLTGTPAVSTDLEPYVNDYAPTATLKANASPTAVWNATRTTQFQLWHGTADTFVPQAQTDAFKAVVGSNCYVKKVNGEGHGFTTATKAQVVTAARLFFDERQPLPT
jgi:acetyl esterase/lipase